MSYCVTQNFLFVRGMNFLRRQIFFRKNIFVGSFCGVKVKIFVGRIIVEMKFFGIKVLREKFLEDNYAQDWELTCIYSFILHILFKQNHDYNTG